MKKHPGSQPPATITPVIEDTSAEVFDVADTKDNNHIIHPIGQGTATYYNSKKEDVRFICYEQIVDAFGNLAKGVSRCDLLAYTKNKNTIFILHELSIGNIGSKRSKARNQLFGTLHTLHNIANIWNTISQFKDRRCILSCRSSIAASPQGVADGFMAIYSVLPDPIPMNAAQITRLGFSAWETTDIKI